MRNKKEAKKEKGIALFEIVLMITATVAIAFILQQSFGLVSAFVPGDSVTAFGESHIIKSYSGEGYLLDDGRYATSSDVSRSLELTTAESGTTGAGSSAALTAAKTPSATLTGTGVTATLVGGSGKPLSAGYIFPSGSKGIDMTIKDSYLATGSPTSTGSHPYHFGTDMTKTTNADGTVTYKDSTGNLQVTPEGAKAIDAELSSKGVTAQTPLSSAGLAKGLFEGVAFAALAFGLSQMIAGALGATDNMKNAISVSLAVGVLVWKGVSTLQTGKSPFWSGTGAILAGLAAAAIVFVLMYKDEQKRMVSFNCDPYQPPLGGKQCELCNKNPFKPCSEYRCKSLGQACELLNVGSTNESCVWVSKFDTTSPKISTWKEPLYPVALRYNPDTSRPNGLGSTIVRTGGANSCLEAFTPLKFGITTNEPAQCKIDYVHTNSFANMSFMFGESSLFLYNHSQSMKLPSPASNTNLSGSPTLSNDGSYILYVRCIDANGNENVDEYTFKFCVDKSPDTTPPMIVTTSIVSGSPVQYNVSSVPIQTYTNEPATCKWSRASKPYGDMENNMSCSNNMVKVNSELLYPCTGNLTSIKDRETNTFYFRCKDNPTKAEKDRNVMSESYSLILRGSQSLNILEVAPNATIYGSTEITTVNLTVETDDGSDEGKAWCYYSTTGNEGDYIMMYETNNSVRHVQQLDLTGGTYNYHVRCIDNGGNRAEKNVTFTLFVDRAMPQITRVYKDNPDALKIVTDEDAECAYSFTSCNFNFNEGTAMIYNPVDVKNVLLAPWKSNAVYYVKCRDLYGNEPSPNQCSVVASAAKLSANN